MVGIHIVKNPKRQAGKMNGISETGNEDGATGFCAHCRGKSYVEKADEDRFADCIRDNLHNVVEDLIKVFANEKKNMKEDYIKSNSEKEKVTKEKVQMLQNEIEINRICIYEKNEECKLMKNRIFVRGEKLTCQKLNYTKKRSLEDSLQTWFTFARYSKLRKNNYNRACKAHHKKLLSRHFFLWSRTNREAKQSSQDKKEMEKMEKVAKEIVDRYEMELQKLRMEVAAAHKEISRSVCQRQLLEEKMRRTLLQGMTTMNTKTLELFRSSNSDLLSEDDGSFI